MREAFGVLQCSAALALTNWGDADASRSFSFFRMLLQYYEQLLFLR